jgi:hypothetical protein
LSIVVGAGRSARHDGDGIHAAPRGDCNSG